MNYFVWDINPVLLSIGPISIHWYGALFACAILAGLQFMKWAYQQEKQPTESLDTLLMYVVFGIVIGARLGHCFFYEPQYYLANPIKILAIWEGGLASHGGGLGAIIGVYLFAKKSNFKLLWLLDRMAIATALFGIFVRSANFVNAEILGKPTDVPWAVIFERVDNIPRHPAQLYEALAYALIFLLLLVLYKIEKIKKYSGLLLGTFLVSVFSARFVIEFFKQKQAAYQSDIIFNTGQLLSLPFFAVGIVLIISALRTIKNQGNTNG